LSRINTNIPSLHALHTLSRNQSDLDTRLERLSTGLQINRGKDAPAGLIASEVMRSEITGINRAIENSGRANTMVNTAEGALGEVSALLLEVQTLTNQAANTGGLSSQEIHANQLQVDSILNSINRIANTTQFNGRKLLDGQLDFQLSGVVSSAINIARVNAANLPNGSMIPVSVQVVASAKLGNLTYAASQLGNVPTTIQVAGNLGVELFSFAAGTHTSAIALAVNQQKYATGVSASVIANNQLKLESTAYGSRQFVAVRTIAGSFLDANATGVDAKVIINGTVAEVDGLFASARTNSTDISLTLSPKFAQTTARASPAGPGGNSSFVITAGGARFQIGQEVRPQGQVQLGIGSVNTSRLGDSVVGFLSSIGTGGANTLVSGNTVQAQKVLASAISQVSTLRGRLGAFQKDVLETNVNSLSVALENVTASESAIRDADFAKETAAMTRAQILVQANTSVLAQANSVPQNVLSLLR
jgi:flagellin